MNGAKRYYFDWAATALPEQQSVVVPFGNPSSRHAEGRAAREALEDARGRAARVLGVPPEHLYWTSGGTEANAIAVYSLLTRPATGAALFSAVEHPSVRENCLMLERLGRRVAVIPAGKDGRVEADALEKTLSKHPDALFAAIMAINNETGAVMDIAALSEFLQNRRASGAKPMHLHCDMVQAAGKFALPLDLVDSAALSAHKIGGPRGVGLLYLKKPFTSIFRGGGQEGGVRGGTENTAGACEFAECLERYALTASADATAAETRFARLIAFFKETSRCALIPFGRSERDRRFSPYIVQVRIKGIPGEVLSRALDDEGFAVSTGSACSAAGRERPVLAAIGASKDEQIEGIRISQGRTITMDDIDMLIEAFCHIMSRY